MCAVLLPVYIAGCCLVSVVGKRIGLDYIGVVGRIEPCQTEKQVVEA